MQINTEVNLEIGDYNAKEVSYTDLIGKIAQRFAVCLLYLSVTGVDFRMELNLDILVIFAIILVLVMIPAIIQFVWLCIFKPLIVKLIPAIIATPVWIICVLGSYDIINFPETSTILTTGFLSSYDYEVIAIIGIPAICGIALAWLLHIFHKKRKERKPK